MSTATISCLARFTCFLVVVTVAALLSNTVNADHNPLGGFELGTHQDPPPLFDDAPVRYVRVKPNHVDPSVSFIKCYCDLTECLDANNGLPYCHTHQGCFFRVQIGISEFTEPSQEADPTNTTITTGQPLPEESNEKLVTPNTINNIAYGCLDLLHTHQTCRETFNLSDDSEFPALPFANSSEIVHAYHCCHENMCNDRANEETLLNSIQQSRSKRAAEADSEATSLAPYAITDEKTVPVNPDAVAPKIATDINAEAKAPVMCSKLKNAASANRSKTPRRNASEEGFNVMQWMASVMFRNFEKTAPTEITNTPNTGDELSQHNKPIFVAPEEFPTNREYPPIYHRKTNFSIADFIQIINVVRSKPKLSGFSGRHSDMNDERKVHAGTNDNVTRTTAF